MIYRLKVTRVLVVMQKRDGGYIWRCLTPALPTQGGGS